MYCEYSNSQEFILTLKWLYRFTMRFYETVMISFSSIDDMVGRKGEKIAKTSLILLF